MTLTEHLDLAAAHETAAGLWRRERERRASLNAPSGEILTAQRIAASQQQCAEREYRAARRLQCALPDRRA